jgi:hypothetical protein
VSIWVSEWMLFIAKWVNVVYRQVIECCLSSSEWMLFIAKWVNVVYCQVSECCLSPSEWMLFIAKWLNVVYCQVSECCLSPSELFYSYVITSNMLMRWWGCLLYTCTRPTLLPGFFFSAISLKQQSVGRHAHSS